MRISRAPRFVPGLLLSVALSCAGAERDSYRLDGNVLMTDGKPFRGVALHVFLHGASSPFAARTMADRAGGFSFKDLRRGIYLVIAVHPKFGELKKTIEIGPGTSDSRNRVEKTILWNGSLTGRSSLTISSAALSICERARRLYQKAMTLLGRRDVDGAVTKLEEAVEAAPQYVAALNYLGTIAYQTRDFLRAEHYFRQALAQDPNSVVALSNLGGVLLAEGKFSDALPYNLDAVRAQPEDPLIRSRLGRNYFCLGQDSDAEVHLVEAKKLDPAHFSFPQILLSHIYRRKGDFRSVTRELEDFLALHPDSEFVGQVRASFEAALRLQSGAGPRDTP